MFSGLASMTVLEMLSEMIRTEEFLASVAVTELVLGNEMLMAGFPIYRIVVEFFSAIPAKICGRDTIDRLNIRLELIASCGCSNE